MDLFDVYSGAGIIQEMLNGFRTIQMHRKAFSCRFLHDCCRVAWIREH